MSSNTCFPFDWSTSLYIAGEALNNTAPYIRYATIVETLRDGKGKVVDGVDAYTEIPVFSPGTKSPLLLIIFDPPELAPDQATSFDTIIYSWYSESDKIPTCEKF